MATITCLCGTISESIALAKHPDFPIPAELCHCNTCRYSSGAISGAFIELVVPPSTTNLTKCNEYASSSKITRYFCAKCGSHVFLRGYATDVPVLWFAWAGCVTRSPDESEATKSLDTIKIHSQAFVADTGDGGLVSRMLEVAQRDNINHATSGLLSTIYVDTWEGPKLSMTDLSSLIAKSKAQMKPTDPSVNHIPAKCHCGTVQFHITRPDSSKQYHPEIEHYIRGSRTKWLARLCLCRSCGVATGNPLHAWTYVPPEHIVSRDGRALNFLSSPGKPPLDGVAQYKSSEGVTWSFCGTCGATVFYEMVDRPGVIDVAVGILRSESGALAEDFLEWAWEEVSYKEEGRVRELMEGVVGRVKE